MIIVDASIAIKWLNQDEEDSELALSLYKNHIEEKEKILLLQFLFIEVANYLATKSSTSEEHIKEGLQLLFETSFSIHQTIDEEIIEAATLAKKYGTSVYDMLYAVIAKRNNCLLVTADTKFAEKVRFPFVKTIKEIENAVH